ncbi:BolA-like protein [Euroglyphus maynei]|uniref:BolA-like protein n=1 Tax=Euroglyphus maynei TaxID=6958 RepID=A0A1Y3BUF8_EURMA|nr:BolA-like protein [Euroglyphus maynei]
MLNRLFSYKTTSLFNQFIRSPMTTLTGSIQLRSVSQSSSSTTTSPGVELQTRINKLLNKSFPNAQEIIVKDISGGCGSMFEVYIATMDFQGMSKVKQHLTVSNILKNEIRDMHGIRIFTEVPPPTTT